MEKGAASVFAQLSVETCGYFPRPHVEKKTSRFAALLTFSTIVFPTTTVTKKYLKKRGNIMGLIKAAVGATGGVLADQWKEFFYCDSMDKSVMVVKGQKQVSGRSSNTKGSDNIISNGSGIAVADGQCMIIVE